MNSMEIAVPAPELTETGISTWRDWLGIVASIGCAIHCAAMPFVIAYLPALGLSFLADEAFHKWMALVCFLIAIVAFVPGILKHRSWIPISIGCVGLVFITFAAFGLAGECCSSCAKESNVATASDAAASDGAGSDGAGSDGAGSDDESESCCDEHCEHCAAEDSETATISQLEVADQSSQPSFLAGIAPWVTPLGGVLLVIAHLLNRRYGCACKCCGTVGQNNPVPKTI